jgi:molecular chaperone GrpE (heat shock protein)
VSSPQNALADGAAEPADSATPEPAGEPATGLAAALTGLQSALAELTTAVQREHERAGHRETVIDRLHDDNQTLRRGEIQVLHEPVRGALYRLYDMVRRESQRWAAPDPPDAVHAAPLLTAIADEIAEALGRTGAERFTVKAGDPYDPVRHRPVGVEQVTDPDLDGTVAVAITDGFESAGGDQILRRAEVGVAKLTQSSPET